MQQARPLKQLWVSAAHARAVYIVELQTENSPSSHFACPNCLR